MSTGRGIGPWSSRLRGGSTCGRDLVEALLRAQRAAGDRRNAFGAPVCQDAARLHRIGKLDLEDLADAGLQIRIEHRERDLDAPVEVAWHPVGGGQQVFRIPGVLEVAYARVLEVAVDDRDHADPRRERSEEHT